MAILIKMCERALKNTYVPVRCAVKSSSRLQPDEGNQFSDLVILVREQACFGNWKRTFVPLVWYSRQKSYDLNWRIHHQNEGYVFSVISGIGYPKLEIFGYPGTCTKTSFVKTHKYSWMYKITNMNIWSFSCFITVIIWTFCNNFLPLY